MCGFLVAFGDTISDHYQKLVQMGKSLRHRGPDSSRIYSQDDCFMYFHRLAIQDPANRSNQPMADFTKRFYLVFNGEIYNHKALRANLIKSGAPLQTYGDTEVLLYGLIQEREEFLQKVEGMFSFVFWDSRKKSFLAARDPFGIKPLYYVSSQGLVLFASEPRCLRTFAHDSINLEALSELLVFRHAPQTINLFEKVKSLPGGHYLRGENNSQSENVFADPTMLLGSSSNDALEKFTEVSSLEEFVEKSISSAIKSHLTSDVGISLQLSGGVDSSLIASLCTREKKLALASFGARVEQSEYDEAAFRLLVVNQCELEHEEVSISAESYADAFPKTILALDSPSPHYGCVALFLVCEQIAKKHKVTLTGEGADEMFGGYSRYQRLNSYTPVSPRSLDDGKLLHSSVIFASCYTDWTDIQNLFPALDFRFQERCRVASQFSDNLRQIMALDHQCYLPSLLMRQDRVSMAHGLESRVPFVDWTLAKALARIPLRERMVGAATKPLLKKVAQRYLPASLINRRKNGLLLPIQSWLNNDKGLGMYLSALTDSTCCLSNYCSVKDLRLLVDQHQRANEEQSSSIVMQLLNVELWLRSLTIDTSNVG